VPDEFGHASSVGRPRFAPAPGAGRPPGGSSGGRHADFPKFVLVNLHRPWQPGGMGLSYHFSFRAAPEISAAQLEEFLRGVEGDARLMGFGPTTVINGAFDTEERRGFSRRATRALTVIDERLKGAAVDDRQCWSHIPAAGVCRLAPEHGVLLVVTGERACETVFGFCRYPAEIRDRSGRVLMPVSQEWQFGSLVDSPDQRYRAIVRRFASAGFLASEHDEFAPAPA
jgi:hypothetical protein